MKYQHHTKAELKQALAATRWSLDRTNPFRTKDPSRVRALQAEKANLRWLVANRKS